MKFSAALLIMLAAIAVPSATSAMTTYTNREAGYSLRLPTGWIVSEGDAAEELSGLRSQLEPMLRKATVTAAFLRAEEGKISSAFPKLLVYWQPDSAVGPKQFNAIHAYRGAVERSVARELGFKDERGVLREADYDTNRNALSFIFPCRGR